MPDAARTTRIREVGTVFVPVTDTFDAGNHLLIVQPG